MNVLLIHQYFLEKEDSGGSRWNEFSKMWSSAGHKVTVIAGMSNYATGKKHPRYGNRFFMTENLPDGTTIHRCHVSRFYNVNFLGRLWAYFSFVLSGTVAGILKATEKYDIIIVSSPPLFVGVTAYILSKLKRTPFVFEIRDLWPESAIDTGVITNKWIIKLSYLFEMFVYKKSAKIIVLTPAFREVLISKKQIPSDKIVVIPNAADFSMTQDLLNDFDTNAFRKSKGIQEIFTIIYVGAHGVANHLIQMIDTAELLKEYPMQFILIGEGMQKKMLLNEAAKRNLNNVYFFDSVPKSEVFKYILTADVGASILKKVETFKTIYSNKTFDYMSCKKPILMAIDGVSRKLIESSSAGVFVEPENPIDFAEKIKMYFHDRTLIRIHGENGYKYVKEHFDRKVLAQTYIDHLTKLIA